MYLGEEIKKLGFGLMRLPTSGEVIDIEQSKIMVDKFLEAGFTYFDTAFVYPGSEEATKKILVDRYPRESYQLASKCAAWSKCECREDAIAQFETSLERTGAKYFDYYLLHNLGDARTKFFEDYDLWNYFLAKKEDGLIKHLGFSFHSTPEALDEILTKHPEAEFVQLQINYADWENPSVQSKGCYEIARKHGKPIIIMEPVKGGMLAKPPKRVAEVFDSTGIDASYASWALRYAADLKGLITVLSGMSSTEQMEDNLAVMKDFKGLSEAEREIIKKAQEEMANAPVIPCTGCGYCEKVCPMEIGISGTFSALNEYLMYENLSQAEKKLMWSVDKKDKKRAAECIECGACEEACPQHIEIRNFLKQSTKTFK